MDASSVNDAAESARPNSSARGAVSRPEATGRDGGTLAHQAVDVAVEHVVERRGAAAREREPGEGRREELRRRAAVRADRCAADAGQEQQRHDSRLRQRHVVAPRARGHGAAAEREHGEHERRRERRRRQAEVRGAVGRGGGTREQRARERGRGEQPAVRDDRGDQEGGERGACERGEHPVCRTGAGGAARHRERGGGRDRDCARAQPRAGSGRRAETVAHRARSAASTRRSRSTKLGANGRR